MQKKVLLGHVKKISRYIIIQIPWVGYFETIHNPLHKLFHEACHFKNYLKTRDNRCHILKCFRYTVRVKVKRFREYGRPKLATQLVRNS